ncbi:P-loop containing nucleoside triphosphate hydrolase protein [Cyathus striatus]|nr:P-loop containing nucleoside triphosphate hydrolase protein [Cyathus striatus]
MASQSAPLHRTWSVTQIWQLVESKFQKRACWFQLKVALALYSGKDVVGCAPTGAGKTLSFWIPLLMALEEGLDKMTVIVTPLNLLGKQNVEMLEKAGIRAISVTQQNASTATFKDIENGKYQVVIPKVTSRILNFIFDEGHCISQWGKFRKEYLNVGMLCYLIPEHIPFYIASATLLPDVVVEINDILRLCPANTEYILHFKDLAFLIPDELDVPPPKFVIYFDDTKETQEACKYLRAQLPELLKNKEETAKFLKSDIWGMCCTDTFGMVST